MKNVKEKSEKIMQTNTSLPSIVGITGKSGSGKSTFSHYLASKLKCEVFSLDEISHFSLENEKILAKIREIFGDFAFFEGKLDRKKLGSLAFKEPEKLEMLNNISKEFMQDYLDEKLKSIGSKFVIFDYALLPLMKYYDESFFKILLVCDDDERLKRVVAREGITESYFKSRDLHSPTYNPSDFDEVISATNLKVSDFDRLAENLAKKIQTKFNKSSSNA